jgi:hypothetical protein
MPSHHDAFHDKRGFIDPSTAAVVHDWYVCGSMFYPGGVQAGADIIYGVRTLAVMDFATQYIMAHKVIADAPRPVTAPELIGLFQDAFQHAGRNPRIGIIVSCSVWYSSDQLAQDPDTADRGEFFVENDISFAAMSDSEKSKLSAWGKGLGIRVLFDANEMADLGN